MHTAEILAADFADDYTGFTMCEIASVLGWHAICQTMRVKSPWGPLAGPMGRCRERAYGSDRHTAKVWRSLRARIADGTAGLAIDAHFDR